MDDVRRAGVSIGGTDTIDNAKERPHLPADVLEYVQNLVRGVLRGYDDRTVPVHSTLGENPEEKFLLSRHSGTREEDVGPGIDLSQHVRRQRVVQFVAHG